MIFKGKQGVKICPAVKHPFMLWITFQSYLRQKVCREWCLTAILLYLNILNTKNYNSNYFGNRELIWTVDIIS